MLQLRRDDGSTVTVSRDGQTLEIKTAAPLNNTDWSPNDCGQNGSIAGNYFAMGAPR